MNSNFASPSSSGHLLEAVLKQLALAGNEVHVVQMLKKDDLLTLPSSLEGLNVTTEAVYTKPQNKTNLLARYLNAARNYFNCRKALKTHSGSKAVFVQSSYISGLIVWLVRKYIKNAVITCNVQDVFPYNAVFGGKLKKNSLVFKVLAAVQRYAYKHADHIITISEDMKETLVADGTDASKIEVVYNWSYQDGLYENVDLTSVSHMFNKDFFNVVYAGNIGVMQNVDILIEAAKLMKDDNNIWFHIIGNGVYKEKLEARAKEYGITNISFWPMQPPELAPAIYSAANVNVIPLVKDVYRTALPSKTATCLACQKPIVFAIGKESKFGQKIATEAGCQVVEADDPEELVEAIRKVQSGETANKEGEFFLNYCGITENSRKYAEIVGKI